MAGWFTKRYYPGLQYKELERLSPNEARQRRLFADLSRQRKELEARSARLSPANVQHLNKLKEFESKFKDALEARRRKVRELEKQKLTKENFRHRKAARLMLFQLLERHTALQKRAELERRANQHEALAVNRRSILPHWLVPNARTIFGTEAWTAVTQGSRRYFKHPVIANPCVDRLRRKEVMFAKKHAGKGHRVAHKPGPFTHIGC